MSTKLSPVLDTAFLPCIAYSLQVLGADAFTSDTLGELVAYAEPDTVAARTARVCIVPSGFFGEQYGTRVTLPTLPLTECDGVPLLYGSPRVEVRDGRLMVYADIIASTFYLTTRYEEAVRRDVRDEHGRFPGTESLPFRAEFLNRAVVDEYASLLRKWLRLAGVGVPEPNRQFSVLLSHDVDSPWLYSPRSVPGLFRAWLTGRRSWNQLIEAVAVITGVCRDPYDTFDEIIRMDSSVLLSSACPLARVVYFFMANEKAETDWRYSVASKRARRLIKRLRETGAHIGLHPGLLAGSQPEVIALEKSRLEEAINAPVVCSRHHYLRLLEPEDGWYLARAGIVWDSTLGYADVAGFRLGVCRPIELFDPVLLRPMGIEEHPLLVMDGSLHDKKYMGLSPEEAVSYCRGLIAETRRHNGEFVMLWHNSSFTGDSKEYHSWLYDALLKELSQLHPVSFPADTNLGSYHAT